MSAVTRTGTIAGTSDTVVLNVADPDEIDIQITGTWTATLQFEGTIDGSNWKALGVAPPGATQTRVTSTTANGLWRARFPGLLALRVSCSAYTSGTATVTMTELQ